jgi:hypothetical protein
MSKFSLIKHGPPGEAALVIRELAAVISKWRDVFAEAGVTEEEMALVEGSMQSFIHEEAKNLTSPQKLKNRFRQTVKA